MQSFSEIIDAVGIAPLAALLRTTDSHVRAMKTRDSIPPEYWSVLVAAVPPAVPGLTLQMLADLRAARFPKDDSPPTAPSDSSEPAKASS